MSLTKKIISNSNVAANNAMSLVIPSPVLAVWGEQPAGRWLFARSADEERLMIIYEENNRCDFSVSRLHEPIDTPHDMNELNLREYPTSALRVFDHDPKSARPGHVIWRPVESLGTHSLFLGLNYPMNLKIHNGQTLDSTLTPFLRSNCVYRLFVRFHDTSFPFVRRFNLKPGEGERVAVISLPPDGWTFPPMDCNVV